MEPLSTLDNVQQRHGTPARRWVRVLGRCAGITAIAFAGSVLGGCAAEVATAPVAPVDYYAYPYTYYDGHIVYNVNGSWYYPYAGRWYYYRRVPPALVRQPVYRYHAPYTYRAPPAYRGAPPPHAHPYGGGPPPAVVGPRR